MTSQPANAPPSSRPASPAPSPSPRAADNGRPPRPVHRRSGTRTLVLAGAAVAAVVGLAAAFWPGKSQRDDLVLHTVKRENVHLTVVEKGALESANNRDIVCRVKAGNKASAINIKWVIEDGTYVKAGQEVVRLESSALEDQLKTQKIVMDRAENDWIQARENLKVVLSQNASNLATAKDNIELARLDVKKFLEGDYRLQSIDIKNRKELAVYEATQWDDRVSWAEGAFKKRFLSKIQLENERGRLKSANEAVKKIEREAEALEYTRQQEVKKRTSVLEEAERALERVKIETAAKEDQARKDLDTKHSVFLQERAKYDENEEEVEKCILRAPADGMVVYYQSQQSRWGSGSKQSIIAQGEPVSEGQKIMQIPDLDHMLVNTRVHEAMVGRVKGERYRSTGFGEAVQAAALFHPDAMGKAFGSVGFPVVRDLEESAWLREKSTRKVYDGQRALVRIEAHPSKLHEAHVKSVATVAQSQDYSSDVKVYTTMVEIHDQIPDLRPGMTAEVTIFTDEKALDVLAVPVQSVVRVPGTSKHRVYVRTPKGVEERDVTVGLSNDKMVEIKSGVNEGDQVVTNPQALEAVKELGPGADEPARLDPRQGDRGPGGRQGRPPGAGTPGAGNQGGRPEGQGGERPPRPDGAPRGPRPDGAPRGAPPTGNPMPVN